MSIIFRDIRRFENFERIALLKNMRTQNTINTDNKINRQAGRDKLTVLLVDQKHVNTVLEKDIMSFGNRVIVAECYRHAIQAVTRTHNDLITINMNLTDSAVIQMISRIKEVVGAFNVVSTDTNENDTNGEENKTLYYIKKSLEVDDIQSILEQIARKKIYRALLPN